MKILIAPDKFKDALDAHDVAAALAEGARAADAGAEIVCCPLGDGGEGTGRLLADALGAEPCLAEVLDPLDRGRTARWWLDRDINGGIIEMGTHSELLRARGRYYQLYTRQFRKEMEEEYDLFRIAKWAPA